jgi:hypothetical protein
MHTHILMLVCDCGGFGVYLFAVIADVDAGLSACDVDDTR